MSPQTKHKPSKQPLTHSERQQVQTLLSDPLSFPVEFKQWLVDYLESSDLLIPRSAVYPPDRGGLGDVAWEDVGGDGTGGGGGINFDTYPQAGQWLYVETTDRSTSPDNLGIELKSADWIQLQAVSGQLNLIGRSVLLRADLGNIGLNALSSGAHIDLTAQNSISMNTDRASIVLQTTPTNDDIHIKASLNSIGVEAGTGMSFLCHVGGATISLNASNVFLLGGDQVYVSVGASGLNVVDGTGAGLATVLQVVKSGSNYTYHIKSGATWVADLP